MISDEQIDSAVRIIYGKYHGLDKKYVRERLLRGIEPILEAARKEERERCAEICVVYENELRDMVYIRRPTVVGYVIGEDAEPNVFRVASK